VHPGVIDTPIGTKIPSSAGRNVPIDPNEAAKAGGAARGAEQAQDIANGVLFLRRVLLYDGAELVIDGGMIGGARLAGAETSPDTGPSVSFPAVASPLLQRPVRQPMSLPTSVSGDVDAGDWQVQDGSSEEDLPAKVACSNVSADHQGPCAMSYFNREQQHWAIFPSREVAITAAAGRCRSDVGGITT